MKALSPREASIFACFTDAVVAPEPVLPAVRDTDAVEFFDDWMARSPAINRLGMRAFLYVLELSPWLTGSRARLRQLDPAGRARWIAAMEHARAGTESDIAWLTELIRSERVKYEITAPVGERRRASATLRRKERTS